MCADGVSYKENAISHKADSIFVGAEGVSGAQKGFTVRNNAIGARRSTNLSNWAPGRIEGNRICICEFCKRGTLPGNEVVR